MIRTRDLRLIRGHQELLNIKIERGAITHLVGPNGSGKSTLIETLIGLLPRSSGQIFIDQTELSNLDSKGISQFISYVPQKFQVFENSKVSTVLNLAEISYEDVYEHLGITELIEMRIQELSAGQSQRINVAMGIGRKAEIYLLDEPFVGLDSKYQEQLEKLLIDRKRTGSGILITSHQPVINDKIIDLP